MSSYAYFVGAFLSVRIVQRVYYLWNGHECFFASFLFRNKTLSQKGHNTYSEHVEYLFRRPRERLSRFFAGNNIKVTNHTIRSSVDGNTLRYKRLGTGKKMILLANGVGTDLYMWLPVLQYLCTFRTSFFEDYTVVASTYRGLFGENDDEQSGAGKKHQNIDVTIDNLVEDIMDIKKHADAKTFECIIGWSTGSQVALACTAKYPSVSDLTITHGVSTMYQPNSDFFFKLYVKFGRYESGFPPEMAIYFDEYNREIFISRTHTASLIKLILALDEPCSFVHPAKAVKQVQKCIVYSGLFDFMTGVYLSTALCSAVNAGLVEDDKNDEVLNTTDSFKYLREYHSTDGDSSMDKSTENTNLDQVSLKVSTEYTTLPTTSTVTPHTTSKCEHTVFTMGSHFVLLEWPELVAAGLCDLLSGNEKNVLLSK